MRIFFHIGFYCFFLQVSLQAQSRQYLFSFLGLKDGLLEESIHSVQQDTSGYIWIAGYDHLQRYDGQRFLNFSRGGNNLAALPSGGINGMVIDKKNRLWILTGKATLGYLRLDNYTYHPVAVETPAGDFSKIGTVIHQDKDGHIILIYVGATFITFDEKSQRFSQKHNPFTLPAGWGPSFFWQDHNRNYWVGAEKGLLKYNPVKKIFSHGENNQENDPLIRHYANTTRVGFFYIDHAGRSWLSAWPGNQLLIKSFDPATNESLNWQPIVSAAMQQRYYEMYGITGMRDGSLWMAGSGLFASIDYDAKKIEPITDHNAGEHSLRFDNIHQLYEDREKNIWICTNKGLYRFNPSAQSFRVVLNRLPGNDKIYSNDVTDMLPTPDGRLLVSTWGDGVFAYDSNFNPIASPEINPKKMLGEEMVWCITRRKSGDTWRGAQEGYLFIYHAATGKTTRLHPPVFNNSTIRQTLEDDNGNMWLGTQRGYLIKWEAAKDSFLLRHKFNGVIARLYLDDRKDIWVCTDMDGVYCIDANTGNIKAHYTDKGKAGTVLKTNGASDLLQYNDSIYMIASDGLNMLNRRTGQFKYFTTANGLPSSRLVNLEKDKAGYVWMTSPRGICSYHPYKQRLSTYNATDGVHSNSFHVGSSAVLNNGNIAFGTNHDFIVFDPKKITVEHYVPPNVIITNFELMNKRLLVDSLMKLSRVKLNYMQHSITIELSTLTYQNLFDIYYKMEGMDKDWVKTGTLNQANYNFMPPGKYVFNAACRDPAGRYVTITTLEIYITSPFWKTWWFYSLLAFAVISILYWIDKMRLERVRDTERVRTRIATSLTKDMSSTLSTINMLSEMAKIKVDKDVDRTREYIHHISENSNRMMEIMDDMIWSINPENDELQFTILRMKKFAAQVQSNYPVEVDFTIDPRVNELKLNMDRRHELFLLFKEALLNAGKHAGGKFVEVDIRYHQHKLKMTIVDNGIGFNLKEAGFSRGLNEMKKRAALLNAEFNIKAEVNTGTTISLAMTV